MAIHKLTGRFTEADVDDEIILMRLDNGELLTLADTAAAIWRLIDGQRDRAALIEAVAAEYDAGDHDLARETDRFLDELKDAGLVGGA